MPKCFCGCVCVFWCVCVCVCVFGACVCVFLFISSTVGFCFWCSLAGVNIHHYAVKMQSHAGMCLQCKTILSYVSFVHQPFDVFLSWLVGYLAYLTESQSTINYLLFSV